MKSFHKINVFIFLTVIAYCTIILTGDHIGGPLILLSVGALLEGELFYGVVPVLGIIGMFVTIGLKRKVIIFICSILCQIIPVIIDVYRENQDDIKNAEFYAPASLYICFAIISVSLLMRKRLLNYQDELSI